jgi:hypothetical protein
MPLQRFHDWPERLHRIIDASRAVPFAWGSFDCALHVCNCIREMTGVDPGARYRGTYSNEAGAIAIYGSDLGAFAAGVCASLGCAEVAVTFARRGDIVFLDNGTPHGALAIVSTDGRFAACVWTSGLLLVRSNRWKRAWRVG